MYVYVYVYVYMYIYVYVYNKNMYTCTWEYFDLPGLVMFAATLTFAPTEGVAELDPFWR